MVDSNLRLTGDIEIALAKPHNACTESRADDTYCKQQCPRAPMDSDQQRHAPPGEVHLLGTSVADDLQAFNVCAEEHRQRGVCLLMHEPLKILPLLLYLALIALWAAIATTRALELFLPTP